VKRKVYIAVSLATIVSLFTLKSFLVVSYYICFTDSFIENYCINKDKPKLNCDGKCYLAELLDDNSAENEDQKEIMLLFSSELTFLMINYDCISNVNISIKESKSLIKFKTNLNPRHFQNKLIKPPKSLI
jgi:hypothetical protein